MAISKETRELIISLYNSGLSIKAVRNRTSVSEVTISKILKSAGITIRKDNYQKLSIDSALVNKMYNNGMSTYAISKHFECSDESIRKLVENVRPFKDRNKLNPDSIDKIKAKSIELWKDPSYVTKVKEGINKEEAKNKLRSASIKNYEKSIGRWIKEESSRATISEIMTKLWDDPEYRSKQAKWFSARGYALTQASIAALKDPEKRQAWIDKIKANNAKNRKDGWVSTSQKQLYYILESSGIKFHEEGTDTRVGPFYVVDCIIPKQQKMDKDLIIEVQGEYWHNLPHVQVKDRQKSTYIKNHTDYDLLYLEELHLASYSQVSGLLANFGITLKEIKCKARDIEIRIIDEAAAQLFYSIFHYTSTVRKGAITFGAYYQNDLVAAISYTYPIRSEVSKKQGCANNEIMEISRLARKTNVSCPNLGSYFIGKTRHLLPASVKKIISYSDNTYGHTGKVYAASGFINDGVVEPDYYYGSLAGRYHKKTIWDRAKKFKMSEREYAEKHYLVKIPTSAKTRWIYTI